MLDYLGALVDPTDPMYSRYYLGESGDKRSSALDGHPLLADLLKRVAAVPEIKKWLQSRPANMDEEF
jgi:hypothetical protein